MGSLEAFSRHDRAFGGGIVPGNFTLCGFYGNVVFLWCLLLLFFIRPLKLNEERLQTLLFLDFLLLRFPAPTRMARSINIVTRTIALKKKKTKMNVP